MTTPKMPTPKAFDPVVVTWEDALTDGAGQHDSIRAALYAYKPTIRKTHGLWVGWATKEDRECAVVATDDDRCEESPEALGGTSYIPKGMIVAVEVLRLAPPTKRRRKRA